MNDTQLLDLLASFPDLTIVVGDDKMLINIVRTNGEYTVSNVDPVDPTQQVEKLSTFDLRKAILCAKRY